MQIATDAIYAGGPILTMAAAAPEYVECVAVRDGVISYAGPLGGALPLRGADTTMRDLGGRTMMPGFIDAHSHFTFALNMVGQVNVASPPVGAVMSIGALVGAVIEHRDREHVPPGEWIVAWGYDQDRLDERRHITKIDLDSALPEHPVMIVHVSGHGAVLNSRALALARIDASTPTPPGGVIARMPGSNDPAGLLMETAYAPVQALLPQPSTEDRLAMIEAAQQLYARNGYTHAQDGHTTLTDAALLREAAARGLLYLDVMALPSFMSAREFLADPAYAFGRYHGHLKFQGIKFVQDGSPQGRTAYMSAPYLRSGSGDDASWRGEPILPPDVFARQVKRVLDAGVQVFVHANGDAAIDDAIAAVREAGITAADDRRTVVIHSQFQRPDQLDDYAALGMSPSYFTNHCFFWGDVHVMNMGSERAGFISPLHAATQRGLVYSNHTDFNVTPLDPFFLIWTAMARESRSGTVIGPEQAVDAYTALRAMTAGAAWQAFEEQRKGMIRPGMLADFVILSDNPAETSVSRVRDITVIETIKQGRTICAA